MASKGSTATATSGPKSADSAECNKSAPTPGSDPSRHSAHLDRLIHERLRLGIVSALAVNESLTFSELRQLLGATDGNLSVHARKLEDAGYVACRKYFSGRRPRTEYRLAGAGRQALERYLDHMDALIRATRQGTEPA